MMEHEDSGKMGFASVIMGVLLVIFFLAFISGC